MGAPEEPLRHAGVVRARSARGGSEPDHQCGRAGRGQFSSRRGRQPAPGATPRHRLHRGFARRVAPAHGTPRSGQRGGNRSGGCRTRSANWRRRLASIFASRVAGETRTSMRWSRSGAWCRNAWRRAPDRVPDPRGPATAQASFDASTPSTLAAATRSFPQE
jgi:hypothetical protein